MKQLVLPFVAISLLLCTCCSTKILIKEGSSIEVAIENAILDYIATNKKNKEASVFSIIIYDEVDELIGVSIAPNNIRILINESINVGTIGRGPNRFIEVDDKLFYWRDDNIPLSAEALDA